jgi:hypothetical protein
MVIIIIIIIILIITIYSAISSNVFGMLCKVLGKYGNYWLWVAMPRCPTPTGFLPAKHSPLITKQFQHASVYFWLCLRSLLLVPTSLQLACVNEKCIKCTDCFCHQLK